MLDRLKRLLPLARFVVLDASMQPTLEPGDRVLVVRWSRPRPGHIVVARDPEQSGRYLVKRVADRSADGSYLLLGDNGALSRDSRAFGRVPRALIIGRVTWRYLPPGRRGRIE